MRKTELLIPASSLEVLKTAVIYGADAVYIGGEMYGLRAKAKNFSMEDMKAGIAFAHEHGKKVYVTANIVAHNYDLDGVREYFKELKEIGPDALIISDPGVFMIAREEVPEIEIHISTQANSTNYMTYQFWHAQGATRVVAARELSLAELKEIRNNIPDELEIEAFVHGAMCISHSGRCLLSNYFTGRDANHGACTHPCRWKYAVMEESRPGEYLPVYENERGTYIFNSKDLCMVEHIPELIDAGIDSLKIEGRMKTALYVATVARTYRKALDDFAISEEHYRENMDYYHMEKLKKPLAFYDVQRIYRFWKNDKKIVSLEHAVEQMRIKQSRPFHQALNDALYTAEVLKEIGREKWIISIDVYNNPKNAKEEIFRKNKKGTLYITREFQDKITAMQQRRVRELRCACCGRSLIEQIGWFASNLTIYYAVGYCKEHGYMSGKIKVKSTLEGKVFLIKTIKPIDESEANSIELRQKELREKRRERKKRIRIKE